MGGNLLTKGKRISRDKYLIIEKEIRNYLNNSIGQNNYIIPRYYNTKPDFGDLDIMIDRNIITNKKVNEISFKDRIENELELDICKYYNGILTCLYKGFQIDFFPTDKTNLQMLANYMDYNIGNFIGKIARNFHLKYGMNGLSYVYRPNRNSNFKIEKFITKDIQKIFEMFDLDYLTWKKGFNSNIDSYIWITNSKYFSSNTYLNPRGGTKKRFKDRPEFRNFINWLKENNIDRNFNFISNESRYSLILYHFPNINLFEFIQQCEKKYQKHIAIKSKFNGEIIMELIPNLRGKSLGIFMDKYKKYINELYGNFDNFIINYPQDIINKSIISLWKTLK